MISIAFANFKVNRLTDLCKRKDAEIEDYVQSRGKLSRPSLATPKTAAFLTEMDAETTKVPKRFILSGCVNFKGS